MNAHDLASLVATMRKAQNAYFKHKLPADLFKSRDIERKVDAAVKDVLTPSLPFEEKPT